MMDYASRQRSSNKLLIGLGAVLVFHVLLLWAINSGLARKFVKVIKGPVEAELLEEKKPDIPPPPPPPPPKNLPPPPPPTYVPPVDVPVNAPVSTNSISAVSNTPQPPAPPPAPAAPPAPPAPPPAPPVHKAAVISASNCAKPAYPAASRRAEEEGNVVVKFLVDVDGKVIDSKVEKSSGYNRLDEATRSALSKCQFTPATTDGKPEQSWASIQYTWRLE